MNEENSSTQQPMHNSSKSSRHKFLLIILAVILVATGLGVYLQSNQKQTTTTDGSQSSNISQQSTEGLQLDLQKDYGNKYADGLLPVGDEKFTTDTAKKGYIYMCRDNFVPDNQAGAQTRGPWFTNNNTQWDLNKKAKVQGVVAWTPSMSSDVENDKRVIKTNGLPPHITGVFPVSSSDPAYQYDRNPSTISAQDLTYSLSAAPEYGDPKCMGGEVGIMLTGVPIFNGFDAGGRDAGAWEVQDSCDGHPQNKGQYHYHTLSRCITDIGVSTVIGFALDGFPITGPKVGDNNILTTDDLDECHGIVSEITLDGKKVTMYHYVMTQDFPYSISCYRSEASQPPGQPETGDGQPSQQGMMPPPRR
jgi:hypothetical protein